MIDTHCHLDAAAFDHDRDAAVGRALVAGVTGILVPGTRPRTWGALRELTVRLSPVGVRCAIGIHPQVVPELGEDELGGDLEARLAEAAAHAAAIGEC
ncbi:MAG TPA: TatD family hydrolase, partial [Kofleriaceae bacterium]|nr:TatD family hydrolase [Kofleriaceae bacterium]